MPKVVILPVDLEGEVQPGENLLDAGEKAGVEMEAGCFTCSCGACVVEVLEGMEHLAPPSAEELDVLDAWNRDPDHFRLACSTKVLKGQITIRQLD